MRLDPIRVIEQCYQPGDDRAWAGGLLEALAPMDQGLGLLAVAYDTSDLPRFSVTILAALGNEPPRMRETFARLYESAPPELIRSLYSANPPVELVSPRLRSWPQAIAAYQAAGVPEAFGVFASEHDASGVLVTAIAPSKFKLPPRATHQLTRVAAHIVAARRLREHSAIVQSVADAEAVFDASGRLHHAVGEARDARVRPHLTEAVRKSERARGRLRRTAPEEALELWKGLVDGRWSLVDHDDSDGRRFILARRNEPGVRDPKALAPRERDVLAYAAMGHSNKYIGYLLGIASSTVAAHLGSAAAKLGVGSRRELIEVFGRSIRPGSRAAPGETE